MKCPECDEENFTEAESCADCGATMMTEQELRQKEFSRLDALAGYAAHKARRQKQEDQDECPHDEHDHGICLDCGKDIFDDLVGRAEYLRDE
jgi:hypothetical protein